MKKQFVGQVIEDSNENMNVDTIAESFNLVELESTHTYCYLTVEKLPFTVKVVGAPVSEGKDVTIIKIVVQDAPVLKLSNSDRVGNLNPVIAAGFPATADSGLFSEKLLHKHPSVTAISQPGTSCKMVSQYYKLVS